MLRAWLAAGLAAVTLLGRSAAGEGLDCRGDADEDDLPDISFLQTQVKFRGPAPLESQRASSAAMSLGEGSGEEGQAKRLVRNLSLRNASVAAAADCQGLSLSFDSTGALRGSVVRLVKDLQTQESEVAPSARRQDTLQCLAKMMTLDESTNYALGRAAVAVGMLDTLVHILKNRIHERAAVKSACDVLASVCDLRPVIPEDRTHRLEIESYAQYVIAQEVHETLKDALRRYSDTGSPESKLYPIVPACSRALVYVTVGKGR